MAVQHFITTDSTTREDADYLRVNNQSDASNIQNVFSRETLHVSDIFCAHHQELSAVHLDTEDARNM
jgi:hypothetical protein